MPFTSGSQKRGFSFIKGFVNPKGRYGASPKTKGFFKRVGGIIKDVLDGNIEKLAREIPVVGELLKIGLSIRDIITSVRKVLDMMGVLKFLSKGGTRDKLIVQTATQMRPKVENKMPKRVVKANRRNFQNAPKYTTLSNY